MTSVGTDVFRQAIDALPVLVWLTDTDLRVIEQRGGAAADHLTPVGKTLREHWGAEDPIGAVANHERALRGESVRGEETIDGLTLSFRVAPRREGDEIVGVVGVGVDVTAERALQAELFHAQRLDAIGQLTGGVAHDFNNMLVAIGGNLDLALRLVDDPKVRRHLGSAREAATRSGDLTRQLLAYSRKQLMQPRPLALNTEIRTVVGFLAAALGERSAVSLELAPTLPLVSLDPSQFEQVLVNLVVNARDATAGSGGAITVGTRVLSLAEGRRVLSGELAPGHWVEVAVSDTGPGIDGELLQRIFEPFFTTKERGTGLGLSTVFGIVLQSGGHLDVETAPGAGATFRTFFRP